VETAKKAAQILQDKGTSCTVINSRFVKPLDAQLILESTKNTRGIITLEEHVLAGGFGSSVLELLETNGVSKKVVRIGLNDEFVTHGNIEILREVYGLTSEKIVEKIEKEFILKETNKLRKIAINLMGRNK